MTCAGAREIEDAGDPLFTADDGLEVRVPLKAGLHQVTVTAVKSDARKTGRPRTRLAFRSGVTTTTATFARRSSFRCCSSAGRTTAQVPQDSLSRRRIFVCQPAHARTRRRACATKILSTLARRAYRRPVTAEDVQTLLGFYSKGRANGNFDTGIRAALERLLVSPDFLFRIEADPAQRTAGRAVPPLRRRAGVAPVVLSVEQHPRR